jgi:hypothetical protein
VNHELNPAPETPISSEKKIPMMGQDQQPLCNLYTTMLQKGGVEIDRFGSATGPLDGLT